MDKSSDVYGESEKKGLKDDEMVHHFYMMVGDSADEPLTGVKHYMMNTRNEEMETKKNIKEFVKKADEEKKKKDLEMYFKVCLDYVTEKQFDEELGFLTFATAIMKNSRKLEMLPSRTTMLKWSKSKFYYPKCLTESIMYNYFDCFLFNLELHHNKLYIL